MVRRWDLRNRVFRLGCKGVLVSAVVFIAGFAAPAWRNDAGLWMECDGNKCVRLSVSYIAWFDAVRALTCLALCAYMFCIAIEVYEDFISKNAHSDSRKVELLAAAAGILGLVGIIVFSAFTPVTSTSNTNMLYYTVYLNWGFGLVTAASVLTILFAMAIAYGRTRGLQDMTLTAASRGGPGTVFRPDVITVMCSGVSSSAAVQGLPPTVHFTPMMQPPPYSLSAGTDITGSALHEQPPAYTELEQALKTQNLASVDIKPPPYFPMPSAVSVAPHTASQAPVSRPCPPPYHSSEDRPVEASAPVQVNHAGAELDSTNIEDQRSVMQQTPAYYVMRQGELIPVYIDQNSSALTDQTLSQNNN